MPDKKTAMVARSKGLLETFGERYNVPANLVRETLQRTAFPDAKSDAEFIAMLVVANRFGLDPFTKQIYAFSKNGKVTPVVSVDGWIKIINEQETLESIEFRYAEKKIVIGNSRPCFEWIECSIARSDRDLPITVREYFDECHMNTPPWNASPKRMLRHRALIQAGRLAFGLSFSDPDSAQRIQMGDDDVEFGHAEEEKPKSNAAKAKAAMRRAKAQEAPEQAPEASQRVPERFGGTDDDLGVEDAEYAEVDEETGEVIETVTADEAVERIAEDMDATFVVAPEALTIVPEEREAMTEEPPISARQQGTISAARARAGWTMEAFDSLLEEYGVREVAELPASFYDDFLRAVKEGDTTQKGLL